MGYNSYTLITGVSEDNKTVDLHYGEFSGSYGCSNNHYLYTKHSDCETVVYEGTKKMGESCTKIPIYEIKSDYKKYHRREEVPIDNDILGILKMSKNNKEKVSNLKMYLETIVEKENNGHNETWIDELESYYGMYKDFKKQGYHNIKIYYGITY